MVSLLTSPLSMPQSINPYIIVLIILYLFCKQNEKAMCYTNQKLVKTRLIEALVFHFINKIIKMYTRDWSFITLPIKNW